MTLGRRSAVQYLHGRYPDVVPPPGEEVDLGALHLEVFWFQAHTCDVIDEHDDAAARRCFETIYRLLIEGDPDVRRAVCEHYVIPHLIFHEDLAWAQERMPPVLAELCAMARERAVDAVRGSLPQRSEPDGGQFK